MRLETIYKLCCPLDKKDLKLEIILQEEDQVINGLLTCTHCKRLFPIVYGIPILSPDEYRDFELEKPLLTNFLKTLNPNAEKNLL